MSIKVNVAAAEPRALRVGLAPVHEALLSLHCLLHPWFHPLQHPWVREMRALSPELKRDVRTFAFLYDDATPDCFTPPGADDESTFQAGLAAAAALPADNVRLALARPLWFYYTPQAASLDEALDTIRANAARFGEAASDAVELLLDEPHAFLARVTAFLTAYWEETFAETWAELEPLLREEASRAREAIARDDALSLVEPFRRQVRVHRDRGVVERMSPHEHTVTPTPQQPLTFIPSAYIWPHVRINCDAPWPLAIAYPAEFVAREAERAPAPLELARGLRAVGDATRLEILRLVSRQPRTTEELAALVNLSTSGLSKHLRALVDAQLVTSRRDGWYVLYSASRERVTALSDELLGFLDAG